MEDYRKAYIAGGCFWGMEELFRVRPGILDTEVGYLGGANEEPTYRNHPGHAEGIELRTILQKQVLEKFLIIFIEFMIRLQLTNRAMTEGQVIVQRFLFKMKKKEKWRRKLFK